MERIRDKDIIRLSPLMHGHINTPGHYTFTLSADILNGDLRALNFNLNNVHFHSIDPQTSLQTVCHQVSDVHSCPASFRFFENYLPL